MKKILALVGFWAFLATSATAEKDILNVTGHCSIKRTSDQALVKVGVDILKTDLDSAMQAANRISNMILGVCKKYRIPENDMETSQFQVNRKFLEKKDTSIFMGYQVDNQYRIRVQDISLLNKLLSAIFSIGSNRLADVDFQLKKADEVKSECIESAIALGKKDAERMAKASGVKLVKLSKISHENPGYEQFHHPTMFWGAMHAGTGGVTDLGPNYNYELLEVLPREIEVTGKVYLTYEIK